MSAALAQVIELSKECPKCGETKRIADFHVRCRSRDGRQSVCAQCNNTAVRKSPQKPKSEEQIRTARLKRRGDLDRRYDLKRKYGITANEAREMLRAQFGLCANRACGKALDFGAPMTAPAKAYIDHCHTTGRVRGILCRKCNTSAGLLEKNPNLIIGLTEYLARNASAGDI